MTWLPLAFPTLLICFLILYTNTIYATDSIRSCYEKTITYFVNIERIPSTTEIDYTILQCHGTFDGIEQAVVNCHKDKINDLAILGRSPTYSEINQSILECSRLDPETIDNSISLTCSSEPDGYETFNPDKYVNLYDKGEPEFLETYSNRGPTDDWRIKPDIVAKGDNVSSTWTDDGYNSLSGTSMATSAVSGSLLLLQQKYKSLHQDRAMRSATLKALVIHPKKLS